MKIKLLNSENVRFNSLQDLSKVIPEELSGKAVNYGQGEGQVEISNTVWGFYIDSDNNYYMQYEEGVEDWSLIQTLVASITEKINKEFGVEMKLVLEGPHTNDPNV
ncbi:MAG: hypothetical protein V7701_14905 [Sneathiella sp.]